MAFGTAGEIINDAATEIGLVVPGGAANPDPWASTDPNVIQLIGQLKSAGRELTKTRNWNYLRREALITTVAGVPNYPLPADFLNMIDQTGWIRTTRLPMGGPVTPQEWQYLKARMTGITITLLFRPATRRLEIFPDVNTPGGLQIYFEYQICNWAGGDQSVAGGNGANATVTYPTSDAPTQASDLVWFDKWLISRLLKLRFLEDKGMPTVSAERQFLSALDKAAGDDTQAPILSLSGRNNALLLGERNVPPSGFGS